MSDEGEAKEVDLRIKRDEDGKIAPVEGTSPQLGYKIKVRPITYGQSKDLDSWGLAIVEWSDEDKLRVLQRNLVEPDDFTDDLTVEDLRNDFEAFTVEDLVQGVAFMSGYGRFFEDDDGEGKDPTDLGI